MARFQAELMPGRSPIPAGTYDLARLGYEEREYRITGTARAWRIKGERGLDGRWEVEPSEHAGFITRIQVRVPTDQGCFSGTVAVEWNNVSGGIDIGPDWMLLHRDLIREGHAWVGVTAQKAGIDGGGLVEGLHLKLIDPGRYGTLDHPGDAWSYDIFTGVGELLRSDPSPLGPLTVRNLIGVGESQSAAFLVTYINAIDPVDSTYDGFFVHGRPGTGAGITGFDLAERAANGGRPRPLTMSPERIRDDVRVPVLVLQSETDVIVLGGGRPEQPDGPKLRQWETPWIEVPVARLSGLGQGWSLTPIGSPVTMVKLSGRSGVLAQECSQRFVDLLGMAEVAGVGRTLHNDEILAAR